MKSHPFDPVSFAFGLVFLSTGAALLSGAFDLADLSGRGILVLPVLFLGVLLVAVGARRMLGDRQPIDDAHGPEIEPEIDKEIDGADTEPLDG